jgi:hypothetical protein
VGGFCSQYNGVLQCDPPIWEYCTMSPGARGGGGGVFCPPTTLFVFCFATALLSLSWLPPVFYHLVASPVGVGGDSSPHFFCSFCSRGAASFSSSAFCLCRPSSPGLSSPCPVLTLVFNVPSPARPLGTAAPRYPPTKTHMHFGPAGGGGGG